MWSIYTKRRLANTFVHSWPGLTKRYLIANGIGFGAAVLCSLVLGGPDFAVGEIRSWIYFTLAGMVTANSVMFLFNYALAPSRLASEDQQKIEGLKSELSKSKAETDRLTRHPALPELELRFGPHFSKSDNPEKILALDVFNVGAKCRLVAKVRPPHNHMFRSMGGMYHAGSRLALWGDMSKSQQELFTGDGATLILGTVNGLERTASVQFVDEQGQNGCWQVDNVPTGKSFEFPIKLSLYTDPTSEHGALHKLVTFDIAISEDGSVQSSCDPSKISDV